MKTLGLYSKQARKKFLKTMPILNDRELVMTIVSAKKKITNQIMQAWETPYMKELGDVATSRGGNVLEVGFGMGISAGFIQQSKKIRTHTIIECHPLMLGNAQKN